MIREATISDVNALQVLYKELVPEAPFNVLPERIEDIQSDNSNFLYVYELNGQVVGTVFWTICKDPSFGFQPFAVLENYIVTESARGNGIGRAILEFVEKHCKERGCTKIEFLCGVNRTETHKFYQHMGYSSELSKGFKKYLNR